jgi:hypothetical protein
LPDWALAADRVRGRGRFRPRAPAPRIGHCSSPPRWPRSLACSPQGCAKWAEVDAEREAHLLAATGEASSLAARPEAELKELIACYEAKGLTPELAREVADELTAPNALAAQLDREHGIRTVVRTLAVGLGTLAVSYASGQLIFWSHVIVP